MTIDERIEIYTNYLRMKVFEKDWHGVQDAASDLRELEVSKAEQQKLNAKLDWQKHFGHMEVEKLADQIKEVSNKYTTVPIHIDQLRHYLKDIGEKHNASNSTRNGPTMDRNKRTSRKRIKLTDKRMDSTRKRRAAQ